MDRYTYSLSAGLLLLVASIAFFALPAFARLDAFIPFMLSLVCLIVAIFFFLSGYSEHKK